MSIFFDKLLENRGIKQAPVPLWKLEITDQEYYDLKRILSNLSTFDYWNYGKEFALFYAEYWRREYQGGIPSKELMAEKMGHPQSEASKKIYDYAKDALKKLHIPVIQHNSKHNSRKFFFRTLLLQGGLPMAYVHHKEGFNKFKEFLKSLLKKTSRIEIDWDDTDAIKEFTCINILPQSYQNENIYAVSLQIIRAIEEGRDELLPYKTENDELKQLTSILKKERECIKNKAVTRPLSISWVLNLSEAAKGKNGIFTYSLDKAKTIYSSMINGLDAKECYQFDIFVSQQYIATYKKVKFDEEHNEATYKRINSDNKSFRWHGENIIDVKIVCDNEKPIFPQVIGCCAPNLSVPQVFQKNSVGYIQHNDFQSSECMTLLPDEWDSVEDIEKENIFINEETLKLIYFPEDSEKNNISIVNKTTNEKIELTNTSSKYSVMYGGVYLSWLEKANYALLKERPFIRVYDVDGECSSPKSVLIQEKGSSSWKNYTQQTILKPGIVSIKVVCPDNSEDIRKFYYIGSLEFNSPDNCSATEAEISCILNWGRIIPAKDDISSYAEISRNNQRVAWKVNRNVNASKYPTTCSFEISNSGNPDLKISIPAPYEGLCLVKNDEIIPNGSVLSVNDFSNFSVISSGKRSNTMDISYFSVNSTNIPKTIRLNIKNSITPLSNFEESINRMFSANGFNTFDRLSAATLKFGKNTYKIRYFVLDSMANGPSNSIEVHALDKDARFVCNSGELYGCKLEEPDSENTPKVIQLEHLENGQYIFPEDSEDGSYVIFSGAYDIQRIVPKLYILQNGIIIDKDVDNRINDNSQNRENWHSLLEDGFIQNSSAWEKIPIYMEIADKYRIPFRTFNALTEAVSTPQLATRLLTCLLWNNKTDSMLPALLKIEQEFAMAFHWNRSSIIGEEILSLTSQLQPPMNTYFLPMFMDFFKKVMAITLDEAIAIELTRALSDNLKNQEPDKISNSDINTYRSQAVGKNSDNTDLPTIDLPLNKGYYKGQAVNDKNINKYQKTLINAPLFVYEYTQGWNDILWDDTPEGISRRRVINFYRQYYKPSYYKILIDMLK